MQLAQLAALIVAGLVIRLALIQSSGYRDDVVIFNGWFKSIAALPLAQVYAHTAGLNYPPMLVILYKLEAVVLSWFGVMVPSEYALNYVIKLPPILMDGFGALLTYTIVRRFAPHATALVGAAFIAVNPAIIYDSAYWGQNDVIPTVLALFALAQLRNGNMIVAWLSIAAALFFKPPVLVLVPLMLLYPMSLPVAQRRRSVLQTSFGVIAALVMAEILALTFFAHSSPIVAARHLLGQYVGFSNMFPYSTLNAFNFWALFQPFFATDHTTVLGLSLHIWGNIAFIAAAACIYWRFVTRRNPALFFEAAALLLLAFFVCLTQMHERYLYYAVFFCATLVAGKQHRHAALILSLTLLLNLEYGLTFMYLDDAKATMINRFEFAPWLAHLCALANIGVFAWLFKHFLRPTEGARSAAAAV